MQHFLSISLLALLGFAPAMSEQKSPTYVYDSPSTAWAESFGNHRAVVTITKAADKAELDFTWRRHDADVGARRFLLVNAATGDTVRNVERLNVDAHRCQLRFGPVVSGTYYFYYLPYTVQTGSGFYGGHYLKPEGAPTTDWLALKSKPVTASIARVESRTAFDSFYPMELAASGDEMTAYTVRHPQPFYLFGADRLHPFKMRFALPFEWLDNAPGTTLQLQAQPN